MLGSEWNLYTLLSVCLSVKQHAACWLCVWCNIGFSWAS